MFAVVDSLSQADRRDWDANDKLILGGASMGAGTALHAVTTFPDRVAALILVIPPTCYEIRLWTENA